MRDNVKSGALTEVTFYILLSLYPRLHPQHHQPLRHRRPRHRHVLQRDIRSEQSRHLL